MSTAPSLAEILAERAQDTVVKSVKVVAATGCPAHTCACPAAMASMRPSDHAWCKRIWCCMTFENLLLQKEHAWNYTGDLASHDIFINAEGMTPKHFIHKYIQEGSMRHLMAPSGKLNDTVQAMLELWVARNKQWRERYGTLKVAQEKWQDDAYPDAPISEEFKTDAATKDVKVGDVVMVNRFVPSQIVKMETANRQHFFAATFTKLHPADTKGRTPYGVCVEKVEYCHPGCEVGKRMIEMKLQDASKRALDLLEPRQYQVEQTVRPEF